MDASSDRALALGRLARHAPEALALRFGLRTVRHFASGEHRPAYDA